ncbi:MAG: cupin domain-containing protein [Pseudomonadales bacterium]|nr:cupin domain-containing protein [Pseudomonadales bacterium]NRA17720.1 cupin domain-containing protein [Oceanospirillaceae bacterium]
MKQLPLGDISLEIFLRDYWQKKPLLIRNAIANFKPIISADELAGLACEEEVESRLIIQKNADSNWAMKNGPLQDEDFANLPDSHWTLLVQAVDHWHPDAQALLKMFDFIPQWRIDDLMVSYASQGGGVGPHYDNYDVFLLQATGSREWQYGGLFDEHSPKQENSELMLLADWAPEHTVILHPGDLLYIPPKVGHCGTAISDDCTTYSIGFRAPSHADVLLNFSDFIAQDLSSELRYQDPDLARQKHSGHISSQAIDQVKQILRQYIDHPGAIEQWFGCYMTEHKYTEQQQELYLDNSVEEIIEAMQQAEKICKIPGTRLAFQYTDADQGDGMLLFVNGMCCQITRQQQDFIIQLTESEQVLQSDLLDQPERLKLLANLIKIGAYEIN